MVWKNRRFLTQICKILAHFMQFAREKGREGNK